MKMRNIAAKLLDPLMLCLGISALIVSFTFLMVVYDFLMLHEQAYQTFLAENQVRKMNSLKE